MAGQAQTHGASVETRHLVRLSLELARSLGVNKLLVQADELEDTGWVEQLRTAEHVIWLTRNPADGFHTCDARDLVVGMPNSPLTRMSQVKLGLFLAVLKGYVGPDEGVVCLSGLPGSGRLDMLLLTNLRRDFPWFRHHVVQQMQSVVAARGFPRILDIALGFAAQGREGKPIGTLFVLGEVEQVSPYLRQLILNPLEGHAREKRNIHDRDFLETLREFAAMDGAFVVSNEGVVESAATYIDAPAQGGELHRGLGARHAAAAAITAATAAVAIAVSESSGQVTVYHDGAAILDLEKTESP